MDIKITAIHEAGHAVMDFLLEKDIEKITVESNGFEAGHVVSNDRSSC
jgi:ATP-dependent Zn protease